MRTRGIKTDYEGALKLSRAAIAMLHEKCPPFNKDNLFPDAIVPEGMKCGSQEHLVYLFHSISIDSMRQANKVYEAMQDLSKYFCGNFSRLASMERNELEARLLPHFGNSVIDARSSMTDPVGTLIENAQRLEQEYAGDPSRILQGNSVWKTIEAIDAFRQYGVPKAALLMKNYVRIKTWPFTEYEIPIKIDRHLLRISLSCGIINPLDYAENIDWKGKLPKALVNAREQLIRIGHYTQEDFEQGKVKLVRGDKFIVPLTRTYMKVTKNNGISAVDLDDAKWAIGAYLCKLNDGLMCGTSCKLLCPTRYPSDNNAVWFFLDVDKRKEPDNLFTRARKSK